MTTNLLDLAVTAHVAAFAAESVAVAARVNADDAFIESAVSFVSAADSKVSNNALAKAIKAHVATLPKGEQVGYYTSTPAVGFHTRAGRAYLLGGDLPEGINLQAVQTLIKQVPTAEVDALLAEADSVGAFYKAIKAAVAGIKAAAKNEGEGDTEPGDGVEADEAGERSAADLLAAAAPVLSKAFALINDGDRSPEVAALLASIAEGILSAQAALSLVAA